MANVAYTFRCVWRHQLQNIIEFIYIYLSNLCAKFFTWLSHVAHDLNASQLLVMCLEMSLTFIIASNTNLTEYSHNHVQKTM